ncbi:MAG: 50S ribosomal protein L29 [Nanoarchaeota archaeon]|nr:50S ribosomal protein L29 [Nanoarchaeota archaeon]MBU4086581.1 50S ribosomal protein L29 [Nanoarchaeota archaeon]
MKKFKEIEKLDDKARVEKMKELKIELIKKGIAANRQNKGKTKEIKKAIARLLTVQTKPSLENK